MTSMDHRREKNLHNYMFDCKISEKTEDVRNFPKEKKIQRKVVCLKIFCVLFYTCQENARMVFLCSCIVVHCLI